MSYGSGGNTPQRNLACAKNEFLGMADSQPADLYVGLSTTDTEADGSGITEPGDGYARALCNGWTTGNVSDGGSGNAAYTLAQNTSTIDFGTATGGPVTVVGGFISDAATGLTASTIRQVFELTTPQTFNTGDPIQFAPGTLQIKYDWGTPHS